MHEYSIDVNNNRIIYFLTIISSLITVGITRIIDQLPFVVTLPITTTTVYFLLFTLFNQFIWRIKVLRKIGVVKTPDLNGTWKGNFCSSYHEFKEEYPATLEIKQTWTKICIKGKFNHSKSSSYTASTKVNAGSDFLIFYSYINNKNQETYQSATSDHKGYCALEWNEKDDTLEGQYFNNPSNNSNHGNIKLRRLIEKRERG